MARKIIDKKIFLGLDLDGVILDHSQKKIELAKEFGINLSVAETPSDIMASKIGEDALRIIQKKLYDDVAIAKKIPLISGAKESLHYFKSMGLPFVLISRRRASECAVITLKYHGLWPEYFNETNAFFVLEKKDKDVKAKSIGVTHFVDDEPSVIYELKSVSNRFLFDPLLAYPDLSGNFHKIKSWDELIQKLC